MENEQSKYAPLTGILNIFTLHWNGTTLQVTTVSLAVSVKAAPLLMAWSSANIQTYVTFKPRGHHKRSKFTDVSKKN